MMLLRFNVFKLTSHIEYNLKELVNSKLFT